MRGGIALTTLVLLAGAACVSSVAGLISSGAAVRATAPHAEAAAYVKRCQAALDKVKPGPVWKVHVARVRGRVTVAVTACNSKGRMSALAKASPSDHGLADARDGEVGALDGLANFRKYLAHVAAGESGHKRILTFSTGEIEQAGLLLDQALLALE